MEQSNQLLMDIGHPKGRLLTNFHKDKEKYGELLKEAYEAALNDRNMAGEIVICNDAYNYRKNIIYNYMAIVIHGNYDYDLSNFYRSVRRHASYKKAMKLI